VLWATNAQKSAKIRGFPQTKTDRVILAGSTDSLSLPQVGRLIRDKGFQCMYHYSNNAVETEVKVLTVLAGNESVDVR
jgi:hypothetical protein